MMQSESGDSDEDEEEEEEEEEEEVTLIFDLNGDGANQPWEETMLTLWKKWTKTCDKKKNAN